MTLAKAAATVVILAIAILLAPEPRSVETGRAPLRTSVQTSQSVLKQIRPSLTTEHSNACLENVTDEEDLDTEALSASEPLRRPSTNTRLSVLFLTPLCTANNSSLTQRLRC